MTKLTTVFVACSLSLAACAVDPNEPADLDEEAATDDTAARASEVPVEAPPLQLAPETKFWCDKVLQESGTAIDNTRCRHRWWKQWHKTFPCNTYWMEYGPWVAGC